MFTLPEFVENNRAPEGGIHVIDGGDIQASTWQSSLRRPYLAEDGRVYVDVFKGQKIATDASGKTVHNEDGTVIYRPDYEPQLVSERVGRGLPVLHVDNATTLRRDQWRQLDSAVETAARARLRAWADLRAANTKGGFDAMATPILEYETMTDPGRAINSMDGIAEGDNFAPSFVLQGMPLPITHCDFFMTSRQLAVSRARGGQGQDLIRAEVAARRVAELIEMTLIGLTPGVQYGVSAEYPNTSKVWGYTNHPDRITKSDLTSSATLLSAIATTAGGTMVGEVLDMVEKAYAQNFYGPFMLYVSTTYDRLLDNDLKPNSDRTIRNRIKEIEAIQDIKRLDYLTTDTMLLVQMTADVAEAINGMEITTLQWETKGGMQLNFKVMGIQVPRIRGSYIRRADGTTDTVAGIVHGTTGG